MRWMLFITHRGRILSGGGRARAVAAGLALGEHERVAVGDGDDPGAPADQRGFGPASGSRTGARAAAPSGRWRGWPGTRPAAGGGGCTAARCAAAVAAGS